MSTFMQKKTNQVVLATRNAGKMSEFTALLGHLPLHFISQVTLNMPETEENGVSFVENALIKARHAARLANLPAIADDSGIVVDALNGAPGIHSARYAGVHANAEDNIKKLLAALKEVPDENRHATFYCVIVMMLHAADSMPLICTGKWTGQISREPRGQAGFGYDPVFYVPSMQKTAAELSATLKNQLSHRRMALQQLIHLLPEKLCMPSPLNS